MKYCPYFRDAFIYLISFIKGRFLLFQENRNFANLFSKLSVSTFCNVIIKFQQKVQSKKNQIIRIPKDSLTLLRTPVSAFLVSRQKSTTQLSPYCNAFWSKIYPLTMTGPPGGLITRDKIIFRE